MKEIKEEIKREVTDIHTYYEAIDGTKFNNEAECKKYEDTAKCIIRAKAKKLIVSSDNDAWNLMGGYDDHTVTAFKAITPAETDIIKQFFLIEAPWYDKEPHLKRKEEIFNIIDTACLNHDLILFGLNCEDEYYFINSRQNIINNLLNLDKKEDA